MSVEGRAVALRIAENRAGKRRLELAAQRLDPGELLALLENLHRLRQHFGIGERPEHEARSGVGELQEAAHPGANGTEEVVNIVVTYSDTCDIY